MNIVVVQMINYTLSFLMWMIVGRGILELIIGNRQNIMTAGLREDHRTGLPRDTENPAVLAAGSGSPSGRFSCSPWCAWR